MLLFAILFGVSVGPWIVAAIAGVLSEGSAGHEAFIVAAPSPFYVFVMLDEIGRGAYGSSLMMAGMGSCMIWAVIGLVLLGVAARRCGAIIRRHEAMLAETDRILAAEDEARAAPPPAADDAPSAA